MQIMIRFTVFAEFLACFRGLLAEFFLSIPRLILVFFSLKCFDLMSEASSDLEEAVSSADEILKKVELAICEELDADLNVRSNHAYCVITSIYLIHL